MNALILAAGFGTRMGELSLKTAKPLLEVQGKPVAQHLAEQLMATGRIRHLTVITNEYYYAQYEEWKRAFGRPDVLLINDGATSNENRLGAVADLRLAISHIDPDGPLLVLAGDNLYTFDLTDFIDFYYEKLTDVVVAYHQTDMERLRKTGVARLDENDRLVGFQEKPAEPRGEHAVPCMYILRRETLALVGEYLDAGNRHDAPGNFINWLHTRVPVHAFRFDSPLYAIGDVASYEATRQALENR